MKFPGTGAASSIKKLYRIFNREQRTAFKWLTLLTFISSATDLIGLSFIIPIVGLVLSDEFYQTFIARVPFIATLSKNEVLLAAVTAFFAIIIIKNLFGLYVNKKQVRFVSDLYVTSSMNVLEKIYNRPLTELQKTPSNALASKLAGMQIGLTNQATMGLIIICNEGIIFFITSVILCLWNWQLFLVLIGIIIPVMGFFYYKVKGLVKLAGEQKNENLTRLIAKAQEMIFGYTDIKIAGTQKNFKNRYKEFTKEFSTYQAHSNFINFIPGRILEVSVFACIIVILIYCVFVLKDPQKIITTISLFSIIAYRSIPSVNRFVMAFTALSSQAYIINDSDFIQEDIPEEKPITPVNFYNRILFDNISYRYPGTNNYVLKNCTLEIRKGEVAGIIGKSGAGKSTLINNILGFLQPTTGKILVDDTELNEYNINDWWHILGYVRQDVFILNTSFAENIALGIDKEEVDHAKLARAIKLASLEDLVAGWPEGIDTMLGERGNNLSGGQKQRIAIARALYKGANVLIFDEATSSLDSQTEEEITNAIRELGHQDLTIIIIAHRYTSLKYCDKIYMLENGQITKSLSYEALSGQVRD